MDDLISRLDAIQARLERHAAGPKPAGLTDPDPDTPEERWEAGQVWAHMAEFVPYWQGELGKVIEGYSGSPVPFGRTKADPLRASAIEAGRHLPITALMDRVGNGIAALRPYLAGLSDAQWRTVGLHARLGEMSATAIVRRFLINHLEEHADQLDLLTGV